MTPKVQTKEDDIVVEHRIMKVNYRKVLQSLKENIAVESLGVARIRHPSLISNLVKGSEENWKHITNYMTRVSNGRKSKIVFLRTGTAIAHRKQM
ncbi:unnamed protein product [Callosobruchus maculatus]|uniref:Uncharacterized protein n=1 Tax=Callosobruchus maculatus TaxID=64391 RepID=A0A653CK77_CALMS|nr:unnamed protein product [Callosobruchus maculatus]